LLFLGEDLLVWIILAFGGAMVVGSVAALLRPREDTKEGELVRPPLARTLAFVIVGLVAVIWAIATLTT
jgi:hypothetical protein